MKVYFSHGKESGPRGTKIKRLAAMAETMGCAVDSVDYTDTMDPDLRVERLFEMLASSWWARVWAATCRWWRPNRWTRKRYS